MDTDAILSNVTDADSVNSAVRELLTGVAGALHEFAYELESKAHDLAQAVTTNTAAASPESGINDDPIARDANKAASEASDEKSDDAASVASSTGDAPGYAENGDIVAAGEAPVPADRVAVDADHQMPTPDATDAAPVTPNPDDAPLDANHVTLAHSETADVDTKDAATE